MRRRTVTTAIAAGLIFSMAACGGGDDDGDNGGGGGDSGGEATGKVGVILPDTESSVRWETADRPLLEAAFKDAGVDYDRLTLGGSAQYYVSFDNVKVGELQGQGLAQCLGDKAASIAFLNGSPDDNNATLFSEGAHSVLDDMSNYTKVAEQAVPKWDNQQAATIFEQMYTQAGGNIQGVLAANDGLANATISVLQRNNVAGQVPVTGQDATVEGLQNILAGNQCMTVYKPIAQEANALAELAISLIKGEDADTNGESEDPEGNRQVPSILLDPVSIFRDNVKDVVDDGFVTAADLCTGNFAAACTELGIK